MFPPRNPNDGYLFPFEKSPPKLEGRPLLPLLRLVPDGVFDPAGVMLFRRLPPPDDAEVEGFVRTTAGGVLRLLQRRGLGTDSDPDQADPVTRDEGLMAALYSASVRGRIATGPRAGQEVMRFGDYVEVERLETATSTR